MTCSCQCLFFSPPTINKGKVIEKGKLGRKLESKKVISQSPRWQIFDLTCDCFFPRNCFTSQSYILRHSNLVRKVICWLAFWSAEMDIKTRKLQKMNWGTWGTFYMLTKQPHQHFNISHCKYTKLAKNKFLYLRGRLRPTLTWHLILFSCTLWNCTVT